MHHIFNQRIIVVDYLIISFSEIISSYCEIDNAGSQVFINVLKCTLIYNISASVTDNKNSQKGDNIKKAKME